MINKDVGAVIVGGDVGQIERCAQSLGCPYLAMLPDPMFVFTKVASVNYGVAMTRCKYIIVADGDCEFPASYVDDCLNIASRNERVIIGGYRDEVDPDGTRHKPFMGKSNSHDGPHMCGSFMFFSRTDWLKVGGYNPFMVHPDGWHTDVDFLVRMKKAGCKQVMLPEHYVHHVHGFTMPTPEEQQTNYFIAENSYFDGKKWRFKKCTVDYR